MSRSAAVSFHAPLPPGFARQLRIGGEPSLSIVTISGGARFHNFLRVLTRRLWFSFHDEPPGIKPTWRRRRCWPRTTLWQPSGETTNALTRHYLAEK